MCSVYIGPSSPFPHPPMLTPAVATLLAVIVVSLISTVGVLLFSFCQHWTKASLLAFVSLSAGTLLGTVFLHILPELAEHGEEFRQSLVLILVGIVGSFLVEKCIHWRHCHDLECKHRIHPMGLVNVIGDAAHNFVDGLLIAGSFLVDLRLGIATTVAVALHEIPQEFGDFAVLLYSGYSRARALVLNLLSALTAVLGAILVLATSNAFPHIGDILLPLAAGNFLYIAGVDLMPELHKETSLRKDALRFALLVTGMAMMFLLSTSAEHSHGREAKEAAHVEAGENLDAR